MKRARHILLLVAACVAVTACGGHGVPTATQRPHISGLAIYHPQPAGAAAPDPGSAPPDALSATQGAWSHNPTAYAHRWEDCDRSGAHCTSIAGATSRAYAIRASDVGHTLRVVVTARNASGSSSSPSKPTAVVTRSSTEPGVYVAQTEAGAANGLSCSDAKSAAWFNSPSNWGPGHAIAPGTVVGLCGTISSDLTAQASGSAGKPITIYFQPGAKLSQPACTTACLTLNGQSYITVDGGQNGIIENTANGTGLANDVADTAIAADPCTSCTIEYLTIQNIYVRTSQSDTGDGASGTTCMSVSGSNLTVADNTMGYAHWCVIVDENRRPSDANLRFYGNDISNTDHGFALGFYQDAGGPGLGPFYFYDNAVHDYAAWDTGTANAYHHDGFHCFSAGTPGPADIGGGLYIYDNIWGGNVGAGGNDTAQIFLEGTASGTACATPNTPIYLFNNVQQASQSGSPDDAYWTLASGTIHAYNNTLLGKASDACFDFNDQTTPAATIQNTLISGCRQEIGNGAAGLPFGGMAPDYNLYAASGGNAFLCKNTTIAFTQFSRWQSCIGGDSHSHTTTNAHVNSDGTLQPGSPAAGAGTNLTAVCTGQPNPGLGALCQNIAGVPRPASAAWNAGAY